MLAWPWGRGRGDSAVAVGTGLLWRQVAQGTEPWWCVHMQRWGHTEGPGGLSPGTSGPGMAGGRRGRGAAGAAPRGVPARAALTQAPQTCWSRQVGVWGAQAPALPHASPGTQGSPGQAPLWTHSVGPQGSSWHEDRHHDGLLGFWGRWCPTMLAPKPCAGVTRGHWGAVCWAPAATRGSPKRTLWALGLCSGHYHLHQFMAESGAGTAVCVPGWLGGDKTEGY